VHRPDERTGMGSGKKLDDSELGERLQALPGWTVRDGRLRRELRFDDFSDAFAFMTRVALLAERLDHHPDWSNVYDRVTIELVTHDAGGITERDIELARGVSKLVRGR
jgi:4a-hydroxytetrahydrobiopterin dehydratase